jgi:PAS domain-containing protein
LTKKERLFLPAEKRTKMSNRQKSFLNRFSYYNLKLGLKLNILVYILLIISFIVISIVGFSFLDNYLKKTTYHELEQLTYHKKKVLENEYAQFLTDVKQLFNDDVNYTIQELKNSFRDLEYDRSNRFQADTLAAIKVLLEQYYADEIISRIGWEQPNLDEIFPERDIELVIQETYLLNNKWPQGQKDKLIDSKTGSGYAYNHANLQSTFRNFARKTGINNIYLIDAESGDLFYNLNKNITLGTNLFTGIHKQSELSRIYQVALSSTSAVIELYFSEISFFAPAINKPVGFIALPVLLYNDKVAVAVIELTPAFFENFVYDKWLENNWEITNLTIVGTDNLIRINDIQQYSQPEKYFHKLEKKGLRNEILRKAAVLKGGANVLSLSELSKTQKSGLQLLENSFGEKLYGLDMKLNLEGFDWSFIGYTSEENLSGILRSARWKLLIVYVLLLMLATFSLRGVVNSIVNRLNILSNAFRSLSKGEKAESLNSTYQDELGKTMGVFNTLNDRVESAGLFAIQLSEGNFDQTFNSVSKDDSFATALNTLNERLRENKKVLIDREEEDKKTKWLNDGIAKFNDLLRQSNNDINTLAYIVIENLVEYLDANQGGVYLVEGENDASKTIVQIAGYAYDRRKHREKIIEIGEGLIGNCYLERKSIHLKNIPEDYIEITSGLGGAKPSALYIVPLIMDQAVLGFIEIASLTDFEKHHIDFIEQLAENIAATFSTVKLNTRTAELLEESKRRANEIAQQEEEMRQNMEEMQATQEELARLREEDERRQKELMGQVENATNMLQTLLNSITGEVIIKDAHGVVVMANEAACKRYSQTPESIKGLSDTGILDKAILENEHQLDKDVLKDGDYIGYRTENVDGKLVEYTIEKRTFELKFRDEVGILTIWTVSDKT